MSFKRVWDMLQSGKMFSIELNQLALSLSCLVEILLVAVDLFRSTIPLWRKHSVWVVFDQFYFSRKTLEHDWKKKGESWQQRVPGRHMPQQFVILNYPLLSIEIMITFFKILNRALLWQNFADLKLPCWSTFWIAFIRS